MPVYEDDFQKRLAAKRKASDRNIQQETRRTPGTEIKAPSRVRKRLQEQNDATAESGFGAFALGAFDTIMFGYLDETTAYVDSLLTGEDYETLLKDNRQSLGKASEENGELFLAGQVSGGFVPFLGWGGRTVKGAALVGGAQGALYGSGQADGDIYDRLQGAALFGAGGAFGGAVLQGVVMPSLKAGSRQVLTMFGRGKPAKLDYPSLPTRNTDKALSTSKPIAEDLSDAIKTAPRESFDDALEDGALFTARELMGEPGAARAALTKRIGAMSAESAKAVLERIQKAELDGTQFNDPHYRSLLKVDLGDEAIDTDDLVRAAELFEEATEEIAAKAGQGPRTLDDIEGAVSKELEKGLTLSELEGAYDAAQKGVVRSRIAQHVMVTSAAKVLRAREELLPRLVKGEEGVRETVVEELTDAAHRFTLAKGILSEAGRSLGILSKGVKARSVDVAEDAYSINSIEQTRARVQASIDNLTDSDLQSLLAQMRTIADAQDIERVLVNADEAKAFSAWQRTKNTVSAFLKSNALSPATGLFNTASFIAHDYFRNHLSKQWAVRAMQAGGRDAEALMLKLEEQLSRGVYWEAHKRGLNALMKRVSWEFWGDVERVAAVGYGRGTVAAKARMKRETLLSEGFSPPQLREYQEQPRLNITDTEAFAERLNGIKSGGGAMGNIVYHLEKARAVTANTVDGVGNASMKLFTGAIDDWGREFIKVKETYAMAARFAAREAMDQDIPQEHFGEWAAKRAEKLATIPRREMLEQVEQELVSGPNLTDETQFMLDLEKVIEKEADEVLFMDGPQTMIGQKAASLTAAVDRLGVIFPYIRTPTRLFEKGVVSYGPFAKQAREVQENLAAGGMVAEIEKARIEIGSIMFTSGLLAGIAGGLTTTNGGFNNSGNLDAGPANRINFPGGGFMEFSRLDPIAFTVSMGGLVGQGLRDGYADGQSFEVQQGFETGLQTAILGARESILGKTYMQSAQDAMEAMNSDNLGSFATRVEKLVMNAGGRLIPAAGIGRQINDTLAPNAIESIGWMDTVLRSIPGAGLRLSPRIDPLGDPIKARRLGINAGNSEVTDGEPISPVKSKLRDLGINISTLRKSDPDGFRLTSEQLSMVRTIRGKEARNDAGMLMEEALADLFADPWFQNLPDKEQQRQEVMSVMREFNRPAWEILRERDPSFDSQKEFHSSLTDYLAEGMSRAEAEDLADEDLEALGLPPIN